ncbi:MAG: hypothetical protein AB7S41_02540 [Parvibaculaceae bacterium]
MTTPTSPQPGAAAEIDARPLEAQAPAPREIVIHVGVHKTGTTAIQHHFWQNLAILDQYGILYPETGRPPPGAAHLYGHHHIPWSLTGLIREDPDRLLGRLRDEIAASAAPRIVLSSEEFDRLPAPAIERIARTFDLPARVVFYYRRQSSIIEGIYGTDVSYNRERRSIPLYARRYTGALDFLAFARKWAAVFGHEAVVAKAYDVGRFPGGNIIPHFLDTAGLEGPPVVEGAPQIYNRSLPWFAVRAVIQMRLAIVPEPVIARVVAALETVFQDTRSSGGLMSPAEARAFDLEFAESNAAFIAEFCPDEPPIMPHPGTGEDQYELDNAGLWPALTRTIAATAEHILRESGAHG